MIRSLLFLLLFMSSEETGEEKDLVFVLNTPLMMSDTDLSHAVDFIYNITDRLTIGQTRTLVAALTYSERPTQHFSLNSHSTKGAILNSLAALKSVNRSHDKSNPNEALETVRLTTLKGSRTSSLKIVVLIVMQGPAADIRTTTLWAAEDLAFDYQATFVTLALDSLIKDDKQLLNSITGDESRTFYVSDFKYSCNVVPNVTNLIDSSADTSPVVDCPDPNAVEATTSPTNDTKDDSLLLVVIGALIGTLIILALLVVAHKCVKGNAVKDLLVLKAIEVYGEVRFGASKEAFCYEEFGKSCSVGKTESENTEENKSINITRLFLARSFVNGHYTLNNNNR